MFRVNHCVKNPQRQVFLRLPRSSSLPKILNINNFIIYILHTGRCVYAEYIYETAVVNSSESRWWFKKRFVVRATTQPE